MCGVFLDEAHIVTMGRRIFILCARTGAANFVYPLKIVFVIVFIAIFADKDIQRLFFIFQFVVDIVVFLLISSCISRIDSIGSGEMACANQHQNKH